MRKKITDALFQKNEKELNKVQKKVLHHEPLTEQEKASLYDSRADKRRKPAADMERYLLKVQVAEASDEPDAQERANTSPAEVRAAFLEDRKRQRATNQDSSTNPRANARDALTGLLERTMKALGDLDAGRRWTPLEVIKKLGANDRDNILQHRDPSHPGDPKIYPNYYIQKNERAICWTGGRTPTRDVRKRIADIRKRLAK